MKARSSSFVQLGRPYVVWAIPGTTPPAEALRAPTVTATWVVDAGCALDALNDPCLTGYTKRLPIVFACERKVDRQKLLDRRATFAALGYRLWTEDAHARDAS